MHSQLGFDVVLEAENAARVSRAPSSEGPKGIAGWLLLVALHCVQLALFSCVDVFRIGRGLLEPEFAAIFTLTSVALLIAIVAAMLNVSVLWLLVHKSSRFSTVFVAAHAWLVGKNAFELWAVDSISPESIGMNSAASLIVSVSISGVAIPYVLLSRRVRNTFIRAAFVRSRGLIDLLGMTGFLGLFLMLTFAGSIAFGWAHKLWWLIAPPVILLSTTFRASLYTADRMEESGIPRKQFWRGVTGPNVFFTLQNTLTNIIIFAISWFVGSLL